MTTTPYDAEIASKDTDPTARTIAIVMREGYLRSKAEDAATIAALLEAAAAALAAIEDSNDTGYAEKLLRAAIKQAKPKEN